MTPNQHITEYLSYYLSLKNSPGFAVLLNGPWGIGKTFLVNKFTKSLEGDGIKHVYVSLYGVNSIEEIDDAIFRSIYPVIDNKAVKIGARLLKSAAKFVNVDTDLSYRDILNKGGFDIYVFDDLERCEMPINAVMGYINGFVEHDRAKVVIIANEDEIKDGDGYLRIREKLIGQTFQIQSVFEEAVEIFVLAIEDERAKTTIRENLSVIEIVYKQSELNNLRVLQQTIMAFSRMLKYLEARHCANRDAMAELIGLFFSLSFDVRVGRLTLDDIRVRTTSLMTSFMRGERGGEEIISIDRSCGRYPSVRMDSNIISDETLVNLIFKGVVDKEKIIEELDRSSFFVEVGKEASWRTIWNSYERTDEECARAIVEMERAFENHEFTALGEIMHVLGLRLWLSEIGAINKDKILVVAESKAYIDHLYENGNLKMLAPEEDLTEASFDQYYGLGVYQVGTQEYQELFDYLNKKRRKVEVDKRPETALVLLHEMMHDPMGFLGRISRSSDSGSEFYRLPILASLDTKMFVDKLLGLHPSKIRIAMTALKSRYEYGSLDQCLIEERDWALEVRRLIFEASLGMDAVPKQRIQSLLKHGLDKVLGMSNVQQSK